MSAAMNERGPSAGVEAYLTAGSASRRPRRRHGGRRRRPLRDRFGGRRAHLAGRAALVSGGHASRDPAVPAAQRQGRAQQGDRTRLGQRARRPARCRKGRCHNGNPVLCVFRGQGDHHDRRAHARRTRRLLPRRPGLRLPAQLHQPRQGPHHDPARDDAQRGGAVSRPGRGRTSSGWTTASTPARCSAT